MILKELKPRKALKAFLKVKPNRNEIEIFKANLVELLNRINEEESEEFHKNLISEFLKDTYYKKEFFINTKGRNDLVIHNGHTAQSSVGVVIEAKKPTNKGEMVSKNKLNVKAFQELVLYYLRERIVYKNLEVRHLVATNINEWFIFDAKMFERLFAQNKIFVQQFIDFEEGRLADTKTDFFYKEIAEPYISNIKSEIEYTHINLQDYQKVLNNSRKEDDNSLILLFKLLSPNHLLKLPLTNDSNSLDKKFYSELLHIIGLVENKIGNKKVIERNENGKRLTGSILEDTIIQLDSLDKLSRLDNSSQYGEDYQERLFNIALQLSITWINRILFLKLLEAQLINYHNGDKSYSFLNFEKIKNYDDLNSLFFQVLARKYDERNEDVKKIFEKVPYLNSSLFEPTDIEQETLFISNLKDDKIIPVYSSTVLKDSQGKRKSGNLKTIEYLFEFLNSYDFSSEGAEEIQEDNKALINASVLGLIFEKINGYKDGSFFTPGFITMYMCRETIRKAIVQKFNEVKKWSCQNIEDIYDKIENRNEANDIVNSIKICDPAVGSGHFLVSALNEIIAVKNDLKILQDQNGMRLKEYQVEVVNDELIVTDDEGELFEYNPLNIESQRVQMMLFHEKQTIIENCLFGVDINPNSVKICRLRLWIELLKNAYYKNRTELETLPNIDINIKCGNSLVSRFSINSELKEALNKSKWTIERYRNVVDTYRNAENKEQKRQMEGLIKDIKSFFVSDLSFRNKEAKDVVKYRGKVVQLASEINNRIAFGEKISAKLHKELELATNKRNEAEQAIREIENNRIYKNAFEWRFEFPEVLDNDGNFIGFDVVVGNPPYILSRENFDDKEKTYFNKNYSTIHEKPNLYLLFIERSFSILKNNGSFSFIIPNSITGIESAYKIRKFLIEKNQIISIVNLIGKTFEGVGVESCILTVVKEDPKSDIIFCSLNTGHISKDGFTSINPDNWKGNRNYIFDITSTSYESEIVNKIKANSVSLNKYYDVRVGLQAYETGKGKPKQSPEDVKNHIFDYDYKFDESTLPYLSGSDIGRYYLNWSGQWLRYGEWLSQPKTIEQFSNPRILVREITGKFPSVIQSMYVSETYLNNKSILNVLQKESDYSLISLLGYLNSKLVSFYHIRQTVKGNRTLFPKIVIKDLQNYPYPIDNTHMKEIEPLVYKIIDFKKLLKDTSELESQIDLIVYKMYGLTNEEIGIIEAG